MEAIGAVLSSGLIGWNRWSNEILVRQLCTSLEQWRQLLAVMKEWERSRTFPSCMSWTMHLLPYVSFLYVLTHLLAIIFLPGCPDTSTFLCFLLDVLTHLTALLSTFVCRVQSSVWRLPKYWPLSTQRVCPPLCGFKDIFGISSLCSLGMVTRTWSTLYLQRQFLIYAILHCGHSGNV
jgi:hypothetical protein